MESIYFGNIFTGRFLYSENNIMVLSNINGNISAFVDLLIIINTDFNIGNIFI